jgi:DNA-nicking Smr family endonuclease
MRKRILRPEERRVWAKVAATVTPRPGRAAPAEEPPSTDRRKAAPEDAKPRSQPPGLARFATPPAPRAPEPRNNEKRVRRGRIEIDGRLDLHGLTQDQAHAALGSFLRRVQSKGGRCGLVITGKGRLGEEGVLRRRLPEWLAEPALAALTSGYAQAHARHGGEGAWYVFVRRGPSSPSSS